MYDSDDSDEEDAKPKAKSDLEMLEMKLNGDKKLIASAPNQIGIHPFLDLPSTMSAATAAPTERNDKTTITRPTTPSNQPITNPYLRPTAAFSHTYDPTKRNGSKKCTPRTMSLGTTPSNRPIVNPYLRPTSSLTGHPTKRNGSNQGTPPCGHTPLAD
jgi:hypothetical protein